MGYTKRYVVAVLVIFSATQLVAECHNCDCVAKSAEFKVLSDRIANLEQVLGFGMDLDESKETEQTRLISDVFVELKMLRKEFFDRFNRIRDEIKDHAGDLKKIKHDFDTLCSLLGNPKLLEAIGDGAETIFALLVMLNQRLDELEKRSVRIVQDAQE